MLAKVNAFILTATLLALAPVLQAQDQKGNAATGKAGLEGKWYLQPVLASDTSTGRIPEIRFETGPGVFSGNTGCNSMRGGFRATDSSIHFNEQIITTKMLCPGYNENVFIKNLLRINGYEIRNGMLILLADGAEISRWTRKVSKPGKALKV